MSTSRPSKTLTNFQGLFDATFGFFAYIIVLFLDFLFKYPEIYFALYLVAGTYKADPRLTSITRFLDFTVFFEALTIFGTLYNIFRNRLKVVIPPRNVFLSYIFLLILGLASLLYTIAPIYGVNKMLRFLLITSPGFFLGIILIRRRESLIRFMSVFVLLAFIMVLNIINGGIKPGYFGFEKALGSNYLALGRIAGTAGLFTLALFLLNKRLLYKLFFLILTIFFVFGLFISGGRGPLIAFFTSMFLAFVYYIVHLFHIKNGLMVINKRNMKTLIYLFLFLLIIFLIIFYFRDYFNTIFYRLSLLRELRGESTMERIARYKSALLSFKSSPLFGIGIGGFSVFYKGLDVVKGAYPHDIFLELLSELGLLGFLSFVYILIKSISRGLVNIKLSNSETDIYLNLALFMVMIFMLINSSVSGDINDNRLLFVFLGLAFAYRRDAEK